MKLDQFTRPIIGFAVHAGDVDGLTLCRMFNRIIVGKGPPRYLSSDHDPLFEYYWWKANLHIVYIEEIKTVPYAPVSHSFVERLIGQFATSSSTMFYSETPQTWNESCWSSRPTTTEIGFTLRCRGLVQLPIAA